MGIIKRFLTNFGKSSGVESSGFEDTVPGKAEAPPAKVISVCPAQFRRNIEDADSSSKKIQQAAKPGSGATQKVSAKLRKLQTPIALSQRDDGEQILKERYQVMNIAASLTRSKKTFESYIQRLAGWQSASLDEKKSLILKVLYDLLIQETNFAQLIMDTPFDSRKSKSNLLIGEETALSNAYISTLARQLQLLQQSFDVKTSEFVAVAKSTALLFNFDSLVDSYKRLLFLEKSLPHSLLGEYQKYRRLKETLFPPFERMTTEKISDIEVFLANPSIFHTRSFQYGTAVGPGSPYDEIILVASQKEILMLNKSKEVCLFDRIQLRELNLVKLPNAFPKMQSMFTLSVIRSNFLLLLQAEDAQQLEKFFLLCSHSKVSPDFPQVLDSSENPAAPHPTTPTDAPKYHKLRDKILQASLSFLFPENLVNHSFRVSFSYAEAKSDERYVQIGDSSLIIQEKNFIPFVALYSLQSKTSLLSFWLSDIQSTQLLSNRRIIIRVQKCKMLITFFTCEDCLLVKEFLAGPLPDQYPLVASKWPSVLYVETVDDFASHKGEIRITENYFFSFTSDNSQCAFGWKIENLLCVPTESSYISERHLYLCNRSIPCSQFSLCFQTALEAQQFERSLEKARLDREQEIAVSQMLQQLNL